MSHPDHKLERYRLGELPPDELRRIEASLTAEDHARLAELDDDDAAILKRYPPRVMAAHIEARQTPRRIAAPWLGGAVLLAGAAAAALLVFNVPAPVVEPDTGGIIDPGHRLKGAPGLVVFRSDSDAPLSPGAPAAEGDVLQLKLSPGDASYAAILSVDGRGAVTRHLPLQGDQAVAVEPGRTVALPQAYRLDDAPDFERFFLVTADAPFGVEAVLQAATTVAGQADADRAPLDLPDDLNVQDLVLRKVTP